MEAKINGYEPIGVANLGLNTTSGKRFWQTTLEVPNDENVIEEKESIYEVGMPLSINPNLFPHGTLIVIYKPKV